MNRYDLKNKAKAVLGKNYWISLAVSAIVMAVSQLVPQFTYRINLFNKQTDIMEIVSSPEKIAMLSGGVVVLVFCMLLLNLAIGIFLFSPLNVGKNRFYIKSALGESDIKNLIDIFKSENYMNVVKTIFMRDLRITLWSLFYVVPIAILTVLSFVAEEFIYFIPLCLFGMIPFVMKYYSYFMTDYIIAENPEMNWKECLEKSTKMMKSIRFKTFVLKLSFIGWMLLGIMLCGIGTFFVRPYIEATIAQLYLERKNVISSENFYFEE